VDTISKSVPCGDNTTKVLTKAHLTRTKFPSTFTTWLFVVHQLSFHLVGRDPFRYKTRKLMSLVAVFAIASVCTK